MWGRLRYPALAGVPSTTATLRRCGTGVEPHSDKAAHRRLQEQRLEVEGKHLDCAFACLLGQKYFRISRAHGGEDQPVIGVFPRRFYKAGGSGEPG